jgi:dephospho-CoA kinase
VLDDGEVSRAKVGEIVFADRAELDWLESVVHPRTVEAQRRWREEQTAPLVVVEIPLLYETGADERFDAVLVVTAPPETRAARSSVEDLIERERRLIPDEEKARRADFVYVNDGSLEELDEFVRGVVGQLT